MSGPGKRGRPLKKGEVSKRQEAIREIYDQYVLRDSLLCNACEIERPLDEFLLMTYDPDFSVDSPDPQVCDHCRKYGKPMKDPTAKLTGQEIHAMKIIAMGKTPTEAARIVGMDESTLRKMARGKDSTGNFRAAMHLILQDLGLTVEKIGRVMLDTLNAEKAQWNKETGQWDMFPDHSNRRGAATALLKAYGGEEPRDESSKKPQTGIAVTINTNIGSEKKVSEVPGTIIARARKIDEVDRELAREAGSEREAEDDPGGDRESDHVSPAVGDGEDAPRSLGDGLLSPDEHCE